MKILAFGASTSSKSINRRLAVFAARQVPGAEVTELDLRDFDLPIYSMDEETTNGVPEGASRFLALIESHDAVVVSLAEHNGSYTAAFKNLYDWASRQQGKVWNGRPMLLLSTSPGGARRGYRDGGGQGDVPSHGSRPEGDFQLAVFRPELLGRGRHHGRGPEHRLREGARGLRGLKRLRARGGSARERPERLR